MIDKQNTDSSVKAVSGETSCLLSSYTQYMSMTLQIPADHTQCSFEMTSVRCSQFNSVATDWSLGIIETTAKFAAAISLYKPSQGMILLNKERRIPRVNRSEAEPGMKKTSTGGVPDDIPTLLECSTSNSSLSSSSKCVSFRNYVTVREFCLNKPLTSEEKESLYYSKMELSYFQKSTTLLARQVRFARQKVPSLSTAATVVGEIRGLEDQITLKNMVDHKTRKINVVNAVLGEQSKQRRSGQYDPYMIRKLSVKISRESEKIALRLASQDAKQAHEIVLAETRTQQHQHDGDKTFNVNRQQQPTCSNTTPLPNFRQRSNTKFSPLPHPGRMLRNKRATPTSQF